MSEYESVDHVNQLFKAGKIQLPSNLSIHGHPYHRKKGISYPINEMFEKNHKMFLVYAVDNETKMSDEWKYSNHREEGVLDEWIIFIWGITSSLIIAPARAVTSTARRASPDLVTATGVLKEGDKKIIHDLADVKFNRFERTIKSKVDTGANMSSLHVDKWKVRQGKEQVEFTSRLLSDNTLLIDLIDQVVVKTSEGTEMRPVISLDVTINGHEVKDAQFNLNDRSHMEHPILIGQNILEKGDFLVDPTVIRDEIAKEDIDWDALQDEYKDIEVESNVLISENRIIKTEEIEQLYKTLLETDISFQDIMRHMKVLSYQTLEEIKNN